MRVVVLLTLAVAFSVGAASAPAAERLTFTVSAFEYPTSDDDTGDTISFFRAIDPSGRVDSRYAQWIDRLCNGLSVGGCEYVVPSPSGRRVALIGDGDELWVARLFGKRAIDLGIEASAPTWLPDERRISFEGSSHASPDRRAIFTVGLRGGTPREIRLGIAPSWSSRGALAFVEVDAHGRDWLCVARSAAATAHRVALHAMDLAWSPDGSRLAYRVPDRGIRIVDVRSRARSVVRAAGSDATAPAWSPSGTQLAFVRPNRGVVSLDLRSRTQRVLIRPSAFNQLFSDAVVGDTELSGLYWAATGR